MKKTEVMFENRVEVISRLEDFHRAGFPGMIPIDNISHCNLRCSMCSRSQMKRKPGIMEMGLFKRIVDEVSKEQKDTKVWLNFFGEPTLLQDMPERISYAKSKGLTNLSINTNANLLTAEISEQYIKAGLNYLYAGLDAITHGAYAKLRIGGDLDRAVENVLGYKELLMKHGDAEQRVFVQFIVMDENESEIEEFLSFWRSHGVSAKVRPKITWINMVKADTKERVKHEDRFPCPWMIEMLCIMNDGRVGLCGLDSDCMYEIDDVRLKSIKEIWNTTHKLIRERFIENRDLPEMCLTCTDWAGKIAVYKD